MSTHDVPLGADNDADVKLSDRAASAIVDFMLADAELRGDLDSSIDSLSIPVKQIPGTPAPPIHITPGQNTSNE